MSAEAISWALNLTLVPADRGGQPSRACKLCSTARATVTGHVAGVGTAILARMTDQDHSQPEIAANVPLATPTGTALDPMVSLATCVHASPGSTRCSP